MEKQFVTTNEVCERFQISDRTLLRWEKAHRSGINFPQPTKKIGREKRYRLSEIIEWENQITGSAV